MAIKQGSLAIAKVMQGSTSISKIYAGASLIWQNMLDVDISTLISVQSTNKEETVSINPVANVCNYNSSEAYAGKYFPNVYYYDLQQYGGNFTSLTFIFTCVWTKMQSSGMCLGLSKSINKSVYNDQLIGVLFDGYYRRLHYTNHGTNVTIYNTDKMPKDRGHKVMISNKLFTVTDMLTNTVVYSRELNININDYRYFKWQATSMNSAQGGVSDLTGVFGVIHLE